MPERQLATVTLRIGVIPFNAAKVGVVTETDQSLQAYFEEVGRRFRQNGFDLQVIPVKGNYYQVLEWAREGSIDGAVVSSFTAHLLTNDPNVAAFPAAEFLRPSPDGGAPSPTLNVRVRASGAGVTPDKPAKDLLDACLQGALTAVADQLVTQPCEFRFVSHLSATGFIVPLMYINEFVDMHRSKELATLRDEWTFWQQVMAWSRFELWHGVTVGDHRQVPTIRFSYRGEGQILTMKTALPSLGDVLLLTHKRFISGPPRRNDFDRADVLMEEAGGILLRDMLPSSAVGENGSRNLDSPWIAAGQVMASVAARVRASDPASSAKPAPWSGYVGTNAWNEHDRQSFSTALDAVFKDDATKEDTPSEDRRPLAVFYDRWYRDGEYAFTVDELIDLLQADQVIREAPRAALVLPGGGVRATYQSVILDYLYGSGKRIANTGTFVGDETEPAAPTGVVERATSEAPADRLLINGIAGTSGGALLGYLASRRDTEESNELTEQWIDAHDNLVTRPKDIFPGFGVLRWFSLLLVLAVFAATAAVHLPQRSKSAGREQAPFWYTSLVTVVIAAAPFLIWRHLIHDPVYPGNWETLALLTIVVVAHFIHSVTRPRHGLLPVGRRLPLGLLVLTLGVVTAWFLIVQTPAPGSHAVAAHVLMDSRVWSLLTGLAILLMVGGLSVAAASHTRPDMALVGEYLQAWLVLILLVGVGGAVFWVGYWLEHVTTLEMTVDYWLWVFIGALFASKLVVTMGRVYRKAPLRKGIEFLARATGSAPIPYTPAMSFAMWGGIVLTVWLAFVAPGLYSSENGRAEFGRAKKAHPHAHERVPLIVSMTEFGGDSAGYRKYDPGDYYACRTGWLGVDAPDGTTSARLFRLPAADFQDAVFASGSPFPIYPAASVHVERDRKPGLFLDGGYAHRVPIEAASLVRAAQVLVVENTSLGGADPPDSRRLGTLTTNLAKGFNFLFERSQGIDVQRSRQALVGTIYPDWSGPSPFLMDFRRSVVRRLIQEANVNLHGQRVARVQSWGQPLTRRERGPHE
ncbi:MAG: hypothetical protein ABI779_13940 [Acidobacteriota bacterium]